MPIIDFHSHILPGIDDGSKNVQTSLEMLRRSAAQGVEDIVATPHFYALQDRIGGFLQRRQDALEALLPELTPDMPDIYLGAEVAFFSGISTAEQVSELVIQGTNALLLEMPFRPWSQSDVDEVEALMERRGFQIILAHLERYFSIRGNKRYITQLLELPVTVQINAESLLDWRQRGKILKLFRSQQAQLLGSDCHGIHHREPNLGRGREVLRKKLGQEALDRIDQAGAQLLLKGVSHVL